MSAWLCEFAASDGLAGFVRLEQRDDTVWYWTYLVGVPEVDGIVAVRDHEVGVPRQGLEIRAEGLWAELLCETPREHWTFGLEAFGVVLETPEEGLRAGGEIGERIAVGLDIEWETPDVVHGDVLVGRARYALDGRGRFVEHHELRNEIVDGAQIARVLIPIDEGRACERTLVLTAGGNRSWSQRIL